MSAACVAGRYNLMRPRGSLESARLLARILFLIPVAAVAACIGREGDAAPGEIREDLCATCKIVLDDAVHIGSSNGWAVLSQFAYFGIDERGWVVVADPMSYPNQVLFLSSASDTIPTPIGREGAGPGKLLRITGLWTSDQGVHVFDGGTGRETVFDTAGQFLSTYVYRFGPIGRLGSRIPLDGNRLLINATIRTPDNAGYPLHILDSERRIERSFGADTALLLPGFVDFNARALAWSSDSVLWVARFNEYRIEKWTLRGEHVLTLIRHPDWFEPWWTVETTDYMVAAPPPSLAWIHEDKERHLLWLMFWLADSDYHPVKKATDPQSRINKVEMNRFFDTMVEVVDLVTRTVVAQRRFGPLFGVAGDALIYEQSEANDGSARFVGYTFRLAGYEEGQRQE